VSKNYNFKLSSKISFHSLAAPCKICVPPPQLWGPKHGTGFTPELLSDGAIDYRDRADSAVTSSSTGLLPDTPWSGGGR